MNSSRQFLVVPIQSGDLIARYAEIDAYSQGYLKTANLENQFTSRNMGKNDLWIAATASLTNSMLITADNDFMHLKNTFLEIINLNHL